MRDNQVYKWPEDVQREVRERILKEQEHYKDRYDMHRFNNVKYNLGDIVFMSWKAGSTGESTKLEPRFKGPLVIVGIEPGDTYRVKRLRNDLTGKRVTTAHVSQLKIWRGEEENEETDSLGGSEISNEEQDVFVKNQKEIVSEDKVENAKSNVQSAESEQTRASKRVRRKPDFYGDLIEH